MEHSRFWSGIHGLLLASIRFREVRGAGWLWNLAWRMGERHCRQPVRTTIHHHPAVVNFGYGHPVVARLCRTLNQPLVELAHLCHAAQKKPIGVVDVGAAVGDTMLLLLDNCPGKVGEFYCVDGDPEFFRYLQANLGHVPGGKLLQAVLSSHNGTEKSLVRLHEGTASAQGATMVRCCTLDSLILPLRPSRVDVLKIDVDGLDGEVLEGSVQLLEAHQPAVVFEWYPAVYRRAGHAWLRPFELLVSRGYDRFVWFTKFGIFSHVADGRDREAIALLAEICLRNRFRNEWHYDVVALHEGSPISPVELAEARFARARRSDF